MLAEAAFLWTALLVTLVNGQSHDQHGQQYATQPQLQYTQSSQNYPSWNGNQGATSAGWQQQMQQQQQQQQQQQGHGSNANQGLTTGAGMYNNGRMSTDMMGNGQNSQEMWAGQSGSSNGQYNGGVYQANGQTDDKYWQGQNGQNGQNSGQGSGSVNAGHDAAGAPSSHGTASTNQQSTDPNSAVAKNVSFSLLGVTLALIPLSHLLQSRSC